MLHNIVCNVRSVTFHLTAFLSSFGRRGLDGTGRACLSRRDPWESRKDQVFLPSDGHLSYAYGHDDLPSWEHITYTPDRGRALASGNGSFPDDGKVSRGKTVEQTMALVEKFARAVGATGQQGRLTAARFLTNAWICLDRDASRATQISLPAVPDNKGGVVGTGSENIKQKAATRSNIWQSPLRRWPDPR